MSRLGTLMTLNTTKNKNTLSYFVAILSLRSWRWSNIQSEWELARGKEKPVWHKAEKALIYGLVSLPLRAQFQLAPYITPAHATQATLSFCLCYLSGNATLVSDKERCVTTQITGVTKVTSVTSSLDLQWSRNKFPSRCVTTRCIITSLGVWPK